MKIPDVNLLLAAVDHESEFHARAAGWLAPALQATEPVGFAWSVVLGFLRIGTNPRVFASPLTVTGASRRVSQWMEAGCARVVEPGPGHVERVVGLLEAVGSAGNLVTDAHLAALAMENDGEVVSFDRDFARFPGLRWSIPA